MAKRTSHSKKSVRSLPKGLPVRAKHAKPTKNGASGSGSGSGGSNNPFETVASQRRPKFVVHNRSSVPHAKAPSALAAAVQHRQKAISAALKNQKKANVFFDQRIGEQQQSHRNNNNNNNNPVMAHDEKNMQRLVRERARHSKRASKFTLKNDGGDDDDGGGEVLTHRGKAIDTLTAGDHVILSDDDEADGCGDLNAFDTELHFGGHAQDQKEASIYGSKGTDLSLAYSQKKTDLDDLILRRKMLKQERLKSKEVQVDQFESMDDQFAELAGLLQFRDKEQDIRSHIQAKRAGALSTEDQEHADWDKEMKQYLYTDRKVAASDRTKTVEEIAKEEAEALHALETRRLARMNGDFDETDDLGTDSDDDEAKTPWKAKRFKAKSALSGKKNDHPEALDNDSDVEVGDEDQWTTHFTADGLVYIDKEGVVQGKVGDIDAEKKKDAIESIHTYSVGEKVTACYRATEQYDGNASWYNGVVTAVDSKDGQTVYYNIEYEDGDFEDGVDPCHMRPVEKTTEEIELETNQRDEELKLKRKRQKAKEKARYVICLFRL